MVTRAEGAIEPDGRDIAFQGTPTINNRVLAISHEASGTGCYSEAIWKWRYEATRQFELIGYSSREGCGEFKNINGSNEPEWIDAPGEDEEINLKTGMKITNGKRCKIAGTVPQITLESTDIEATLSSLQCTHSSQKKTIGQKRSK